jgi:hypothetical protein
MLLLLIIKQHYLHEGLMRQAAAVSCPCHRQAERAAALIQKVQHGSEPQRPAAAEVHIHRQLVLGQADEVALREG